MKVHDGIDSSKGGKKKKKMNWQSQTQRRGMIPSAIRLYTAVNYHLNTSEISSDIITLYKQSKDVNFEHPTEFAEVLELSLLDEDLDAESILNNYFESKKFEAALVYMNNKHEM
jgi:hypothetical protein